MKIENERLGDLLTNDKLDLTTNLRASENEKVQLLESFNKIKVNFLNKVGLKYF